jgi:hypothetical protein
VISDIVKRIRRLGPGELEKPRPGLKSGIVQRQNELLAENGRCLFERSRQ